MRHQYDLPEQTIVDARHRRWDS